MSHFSKETLLDKIKEINSEIILRDQYFDNIINNIKKKKEGTIKAQFFLSKMLTYQPIEGDPIVNKENVMFRLNYCKHWLNDCDSMIMKFELIRDNQIRQLLFDKEIISKLLIE